MAHTDHDRHSPPASRSQARVGPDPRRIVDLEAAPAPADTPIHNIAADLEGAPAWRLWAMVAILGAGTSLALLAT